MSVDFWKALDMNFPFLNFFKFNQPFLISSLVLISCWLIELMVKPKRVKWSMRVRSYKNNFFILLVNNLIMVLISATSLYWVASNNSFGLLVNIHNPFLKFILSLMVFDFLIYLWHVLNHRIPFLWRFHSCHHSDKDLNSTTGFRFHIGELFLSIFYKSFFIVLIGVESSFVIFYETIIFCFAVFHHSDIKVPLENNLKYLFVLPIHHTTHHSPNREIHDSNYGVVFSFWDRLFKTYNPHQPQKFGLVNESEKNFFSFFLFAFNSKKNITWIIIFFVFLLFLHRYLNNFF